MNWEEIKEIIEADGGKFIIVENGKPTMVITSYEDYKKKIKGVNIQTSTRFVRSENVQKPLPKELESEELKIEDLPF